MKKYIKFYLTTASFKKKKKTTFKSFSLKLV